MKKHLSTILVLALLINLFPASLVFAAKKEQGNPSQSLSDLPPFPEDVDRAAIDYSKVDWEREVVLPKDDAEYAQKLEQLEHEKKFDETAKLKRKTTKLGS